MSVEAGPAIDHPPARRALRRRWRWALLEIGIGGLLVAASALLYAADIEEGVLAFLVGAPLVVLGLVGVVGSTLIRRVLREYTWQRYNGRFTFVVARAAVLDARHGATGQRVLLRVWTPNIVRQRSLPPDDGPLWIAIGDGGRGAAANAGFDHLVLVTRYAEDSRRQRRLERALEVTGRTRDAAPRSSG